MTRELRALYEKQEERLGILQDEGVGGCMSYPSISYSLSTCLGGFITLRKEENWRSLYGLVHTVMEDRIREPSAPSYNSDLSEVVR